MSAGLDQIRADGRIPESFPDRGDRRPHEAAADQPLGDAHVDRTDRRFVTLDPASSVDLDQAFAIELAGDDMMLHYAIADVGWFVQPGDPLDVEAFERAVTVYLPDRRATLYPPILSRRVPPACCPTSIVRQWCSRCGSRPTGSTSLDGVERAIVRNQAKLAYDAVAPSDLPDGFDELHRRIEAAEAARGAPRVEFPEQEIDVTDGGYALRFRPRLTSEEHNAALSLATNLAVADALYDAGNRAVPGDARRRRAQASSAPPLGAGVRARLAERCRPRRVRAVAAP